MDYSLVVVSRNRAPFLARLLSYYANHRTVPIFLGDASEGDDRRAVERVVDAYRDRVRLLYTCYPAETSPLLRLRSELAKVRTTCVAWVGDDDFLLPAALDRAVTVLEQDPRCAAVIGKAVLFTVEGDGAHGRVGTVGDYLQQGCTEDTASERLLVQATHGTALTYSLRHTALARAIVDKFGVEEWPDDVFGYHFYELLDGFLTALSGKVIASDQLMMVRQAHIASTAARGAKDQPLSRMSAHPKWNEWSEKMLDLLTRELLREQADLTAERAREVAEIAFRRRMAGTLRKPARESSRRRQPSAGVVHGLVGFARRHQRLLKQRIRLGEQEYGELSKVLSVVESAAEPALEQSALGRIA